MQKHDEFICRMRKLPSLMLLVLPSLGGVWSLQMPGPGASKLLFFAMAGFCFFLAVIGLRAVIASFGNPTKIVVTDTLLIMPKNGMSKVMLEIPLSTITGTWIQEIGGQHILHIKAGGYERLISSMVLARASQVEEIQTLIETRRAEGIGAAFADNRAEKAMLAAVEQQRKTDPLIGAKIGGKEVLARLMEGMKDGKGVHVESLLCALGALAGYACQANLRAQAIGRGMNPDAPFQVVETKDGKKYYFGDALNQALAEGQLSVWSLAAGAAQHVGARSFPDLREIFQRTSASVGTSGFGKPTYPSVHAAGDLPINYLKLWPALLPTVRKFADEPKLWPVTFAFAIQEAIEAAKTAISPEMALTIVMEAAIPMSKVQLTAP